ncbi:hypothetical protein Y1Q_0008132 [Alligator mississippiensis]|uniref:Uncharacterized protein n=1 Tax=Alligator mississippiensis TaxID=8496 RepID=A0A151N6K0_ALLMI|nr:hypothetical protein Y1Q_0008132 [Alligator mississippiensis]
MLPFNPAIVRGPSVNSIYAGVNYQPGGRRGSAWHSLGDLRAALEVISCEAESSGRCAASPLLLRGMLSIWPVAREPE